MLKLKEYGIKDVGSVVLILFSSLYVGIGIALFQVYSSDFKEFNPPFISPIFNSLVLPGLVLIIPTIFLTIMFIFLNIINKKSSSILIIITVSTCLVLYLLRVNYLLNPGYTQPYPLLGFIIFAVFVIVLVFNRFIFTFFQFLTLISAPLTLYFCFEYYSFLNKNKSDIDGNIKLNYIHKIGNSDTPVFFIIFDELSSYLLLDHNKEIDGNFFPELKEFSKTSTWYPNATAQVSETLTTTSSLFSGYDFIKDCKTNKKLCEHSIIWGLVRGKSPTKDIRKLSGIESKTNKIDLWHPLDKYKVQKNTLKIIGEQKYGSLNKSLKGYLKSIIDIFLLSLQNPNWSITIFGADTYLDLSSSKHAKGAIVDGLPESYGFLACATKANRAIIRFNLFNDRIDPDKYLINSILTSLTHAPLCFDTDGVVEVVYPIRPILDNGKVNYLPDAVAMTEYTQTSCTNDETAYNVRRSRINQSMLATKMFNKTIAKIKQLGIFDKSLIVAVSDHGVGFLGPSFGRGNYMGRKKEDILDNRMMNASILLMIKYPYQKKAETDYRMVRPVDVGATLMEILKFKPPWDIDGQSLISENWKKVSSPLDFFQLLYKDNSWKNRVDSGIFVNGEVIEPLKYFDIFKKKANTLKVLDSKWIGKDIKELPLLKQKSGKLEYLKIEKALPTENKGDYVLTLGGYSMDPNLSPSNLTYISANNKIIKVIKPCLSFSKSYHKIGSVLAGWVVTIPRNLINSKKLQIRAFSPIENSDEELFYELENPIYIELTDEQFQKVGNVN
jgi:hypothetical protein